MAQSVTILARVAELEAKGGPNVRASAIELRSVQGTPPARSRDVLLDLFGLSISEGPLVDILSAVAKRWRSR